MKKLISLFMIVAMGVLLASCGGGNAASSGSSSNAGSTPSLDNSCTQAVHNYIDNYRVWGKDFEYIKLTYKTRELEFQTEKKCYLNDIACLVRSGYETISSDSETVNIYRGDQHSALRSLVNNADNCYQVIPGVYELVDGNFTYQIRTDMPQEVNPVQIVERYSDTRINHYEVQSNFRIYY